MKNGSKLLIWCQVEGVEIFADDKVWVPHDKAFVNNVIPSRILGLDYRIKHLFPRAKFANQ